MVWFRKRAIKTPMSSSSPVTSFNFEAKSQEPHNLWEGVSTVLSAHQMHYNSPETDAGRNIGW